MPLSHKEKEGRENVMERTNTTKGARIGYTRVSTLDQNTERQLVDIRLDRTFEEKAAQRIRNAHSLKPVWNISKKATH